jgi:hypothetical protein
LPFRSKIYAQIGAIECGRETEKMRDRWTDRQRIREREEARQILLENARESERERQVRMQNSDRGREVERDKGEVERDKGEVERDKRGVERETKEK